MMARPYHTRSGPRPHLWRTGPDPLAHAQYTAWLKHRAQATWRGEGYELTFQDWQALWQGLWHRRGRGSRDLMLTRRDWNQAWSRANCEVITRHRHAYNQMQQRLSRGVITCVHMQPGPAVTRT